MNNFPKKYIAAFLSFSLVMALITCCCFSLSSLAANIGIKSTNQNEQCHGHSDKGSESSKSEDCECNYSDAILASLNFDLIKPNFSQDKSFKNIVYFYAAFNSIKNDFVLRSEHSPPRFHRRSVSLYLENSILRI